MSGSAVPGDVDSLALALGSLLTEAERRAFLGEHPSLRNAETVAALATRVNRQARVNTTEALHLADAAITIAESLGTPEALAEAQRAKANALYISGQNAPAAEFHQRAAALFARAGNQMELARTLSTSIQPLLLLGQYDRALAAGEQAREIFRVFGNMWRLARVELNIGNIYYRQDRFAEAYATYQRSYEELLKHDDPEGVAGALSNLATCGISLNDFGAALGHYEQARAFCASHDMPLLVVQADYNIAYLYFLRGEYGRAIEMLRAARVTAKKLDDRYHGSLCNLDLSEIYLELNLHTEAVELAQEANAGFKGLGMGYEAAKSLAFAAIASSQLGAAFEGLKRFAEAKEIFQREKNIVWPSLIDLYQALVLFSEGRLFEARRLAQAARDFFRASPLAGKAVLAELLLARIVLRMGQPAEALRHCRDAHAAGAKLQSPVLIYQTEFLTGQVLDATGDRGSFEHYKQARGALETLRGSLRGEELKIAFFKNKLEVYENLVAACLSAPAETNTIEEAFGYVEQAKSRGLMDLLLQPVKARASEPAGEGQSELVRSIRNLREELNWYYNLIEREQLRPEEKSPQRLEVLERQARARESDLLRVLQEASLSEATDAGVPLPTNLPLAEIRAALPPHTALIEYFTVHDRIVGAVLTRDALHMSAVTLTSRVASLLRLWQFQISKFRLSENYVSSFQDAMLKATLAHLQSLYQELIAPLAEHFGGVNGGTEHLIFVPHGALHYVPFHSLYDGERYLIDRHTISYAPSASILALCQRATATYEGAPLLMGVADAQAPLIADEIESLRALLPEATVFTGNAASEDALRRTGPNSRIVHIATHGYFRQDNPMFSSIRLAGSYLSLYDLYQLKLPCELAVLSGCATGVSVVAAGDELMGMVRGLLQAGAQSLVLSLWDVHDKSTAEFMAAFYRRLQSDSPKPQALRDAMQELRARYPHPYHWAPFVLVGRV